MSKGKDFAKDVIIKFRISPFKKLRVKARAKSLGLPVSKYIMNLINEDLNNKKRDGVINKHHPFDKQN